MKVAQALFEMVERSVEGLGYELVDVERAGGGLLRVTLDAPAGAAAPAAQVAGAAQAADGGDGLEVNGIRLEDCERVSRQLTHLFAVENVDYDRLEVSSPGVDRPLRRVRDFVRFCGAPIDVRLRVARDGRRRLRGRLLAVEPAPADAASAVAAGGGAEAETARLRIELAADDGVPAAGARRAAGVAPRPKASAKPKARGKAAAPAQVVELSLAELESARLVPQLDFRGARKR